MHLLEQMTMTTAGGSRSLEKMAFKMLMARRFMMMITLVVKKMYTLLSLMKGRPRRRVPSRQHDGWPLQV